MPTTFIDDQYPVKQCSHPEHHPPSHIVIPTGKIMVHECPKCHRVIKIRSNQAYLKSNSEDSIDSCMQYAWNFVGVLVATERARLETPRDRLGS